MCTYNGAKHIKEQLDSIAHQYRLPDELIICDDRSTDNTVSIVNNFAARASFPVRLVVNDNTLGSTINFEKAIGLCSGDIIVLADQDDIWYSHKLTVIEKIFTENSSVGLIFSDADVVEEDLKPFGYTLWDSFDFDNNRQKMVRGGQAFNVLINNNYVTGATMAFRSRLRDMIMPISPNWVHDGWIALIASVVTSIAIIPDALIQYRQHAEQQIGAVRKGLTGRMAASSDKDGDYFSALAKQYQEVIDKLSSDHLVIEQAKIKKLSEKVRHLNARASINYGVPKRFIIILMEFIKHNYHQYSSGFSSIAKDLVSARLVSR